MEFWKRTHTCGELRPSDVGKVAALSGWVRRRRDHGGVIFIDLCDRTGVTQVVFNPEVAEAAHKLAEELRSEYVISVKGPVRKRPEGMVNPNLSTGEVEVMASNLKILNVSKTPPFPIEDEVDIQEDLRLKYRYLDLRRPRMLKNLELRHRVARKVREVLSDRGFWEIETPLLTRSTPEGARDYLVPSRVHPGQFYALPQSPQLFKQMLMVAGVDKYFQLARCLRDEDLRADRQPEHTQIDIEMSFVRPEDIFEVVEDMLRRIFFEVLGVRIKTPVARMPYAEAMLKYGTDKPDLRFGLEIKELTDIFRGSFFRVFRETIEGKGVVRGFSVPGGAKLSLKQMDELTKFCREAGAGGLIWVLDKAEGGFKSPMKKFLSEEELSRLRETVGGSPGDCVFMIADAAPVAAEVLGRLRLKVARDFNLIPETGYDFIWIVDFPLLAYNEEEGRFEAVHHPFTSPLPEDLPLLDTDPGRVRSRAYDLVLNGVELGGGSIRIHQLEMQKKIFSLLKINEDDARRRFGFLLDALQYGAPPHGGIGLGLDRLLMLMGGFDSIREVITFPKTQQGVCLTTGSPAEVEPIQLKELHIKSIEEG